MHLHVLQHVPFEGPAHIADWAAMRGHSLSISHLYAGDPLPEVEAFDRLVVMGGPMGVADEVDFSWLQPEKQRIADAIAAGRSVVGICLGAQLIADVLGASVHRGPEKEIGWFPVVLTAAGRSHPISADLPAAQRVFHWHGDTFDLPAGAVHLAASDVCENQAFLYDERVLALQFHMESTPASVDAICTQCAAEILPGRAVQTAEIMRSAEPERYAGMHRSLDLLLDRLAV